MTKVAKKHREKSELIDKAQYPLEDAVEMLTKVSTSSFDGSAEVHVRLGIDTEQGDQQVRSTVTLPHGTGKEVRIAAVVPEDKAADAKKAGAVKAGQESLIAEIEKGKLDFDIVVAHPSVMKDLGKVARVLGQKGLMPNPKAGTVTDDPTKAIAELKKGRIEFRADKQGIVHSIFGKVSFGKEKLTENLQTLLQALKDAKPAAVKSDYIKSVSVCPSMGPGIRIEVASV